MWRCFILFAQPHPTPPCSSAIYCLAELLEFAAFVWLRVKAPNLHRPYRVPLPTWGLILMLLPANALLVRARVDGGGRWHCRATCQRSTRGIPVNDPDSVLQSPYMCPYRPFRCREFFLM